MTGIVPEQRQTIGEASTSRSLSRPFLIAATIVLLLGLPSLVYYLSFCLAFNFGQLMLPSAQMLHHLPLPTAASIGLVVGWIVFHGLLQIYAPGKWVNGVPLPNGKRLKYKINGWTSWWAMWALLAAAVSLHFLSPATLADEFGTLLITANIVSYLLSLFLYWYYKRGTQQQGIGSAILDFWLGTALNPRIGTFDLKLFFEARPGLTAWVVLDLSFMIKQYELHGFVSVPMILVCVFHFWYVTDYFWHEEAILTTWDIRHENFGWMLCWGDLVWVPFTYTDSNLLSGRTHP